MKSCGFGPRFPQMFLGCAFMCALITPAAFARQGQPADGKPLEAKIVEVDGDVKQAPIGTSTEDRAAWTAINLGDLLSAGTQIRTGFRSHATLLFGTDTVVSIRRMTLASIDDAFADATTKTIRLGLGYGAVRGGSTESELRTDVIVDSTVATLAKRGTEGWQMSVEPSTGRFNIALSRTGLVTALSKLTGQSREVLPGEYANDLNIMTMWINQEIFDRAVKFYSDESVTEAEAQFAAENTGGNSVLDPGASGGDSFSERNQPTGTGTGGTEAPPDLIQTVLILPDGDFGFANTFGSLLGFDGLLRATGRSIRRMPKGPVRVLHTVRRRSNAIRRSVLR